MDRFTGRSGLFRTLPMISALVVMGVGFAMTVRALVEAGIVIINL